MSFAGKSGVSGAEHRALAAPVCLSGDYDSRCVCILFRGYHTHDYLTHPAEAAPVLALEWLILQACCSLKDRIHPFPASWLTDRLPAGRNVCMYSIRVGWKKDWRPCMCTLHEEVVERVKATLIMAWTLNVLNPNVTKWNSCLAQFQHLFPFTFCTCVECLDSCILII